MRYGVISSRILFDDRFNPGRRMDTALGLTLAQIVKGEPLDTNFREFFTSESAYRVWERSFLKIKDPDLAAAKVLKAMCFESLSKEALLKIDPTMLRGARQIASKVAKKLIKEIERDSRVAKARVSRLTKLTV